MCSCELAARPSSAAAYQDGPRRSLLCLIWLPKRRHNRPVRGHGWAHPQEKEARYETALGAFCRSLGGGVRAALLLAHC